MTIQGRVEPVLIVLLFVLGFTFPSVPVLQAAQLDQPGPVRSRVVVKQDTGQSVHWILPGKRRLGREAFGTPENPRSTCESEFRAARERSPRIYDLLQNIPFMVCVPEKYRSTNPDGSQYTRLTVPTYFSETAKKLSSRQEDKSRFFATFINRDDRDGSTPYDRTDDEALIDAQFYDPQGNRYDVNLVKVLKPPFPGYETMGGVMIDNVHHGLNGTGSPLMPRAYTRAAVWGAGNVRINGTPLEGHRLIHLMSTEMTRGRDYRLAFDEDLPLSRNDRYIKNQTHHSHLIVYPVKLPSFKFNQNVSRYRLSTGRVQPFIYVIYDDDTVTVWDVPRGDS